MGKELPPEHEKLQRVVDLWRRKGVRERWRWDLRRRRSSLKDHEQGRNRHNAILPSTPPAQTAGSRALLAHDTGTSDRTIAFRFLDLLRWGRGSTAVRAGACRSLVSS
jgi:hypothetical protein